MMGDNLFGAYSNLTPSEGQLLSEKNVKKFKEEVKSILKNGGDRYIIAFNWNTQCANATVIEQGLNPVYVITEITV